jgi:predicted RNase H-like HicB family nuclease
MERYVGVLRKTRSSEFGVEFPDLPGCISAGSTLEEARAMAREALRLHLDGLADDREAAPLPSDLDAVAKKLRRHRGDDFYGLVEIEAEPAQERVIRVNITVEERLLKAIDAAAVAEGMTRSGFLADAARRSMSRARSTRSNAKPRAKRR